MAKKKVKKKKAAKPARKRPKKATSKAVSGRKPRKRAKPRRIDPMLLLLAKIDRIKERVPHIEPTGECIDENTGEVLFRFTEAQHVFEVYREQCDREHLHFRPYIDGQIQPQGIAVGNMPLMIGVFCIEDLDTGARIIGWGSGMGRNRDWSGNTANTRALKQFLLNTFEATWQDPDKPILKREQMREEVIRELAADGTLEQLEQIKFWAKDIDRGKMPQFKGEQDGTSSGKKHPNGDNTGKDGKGNRKGAKRDYRQGQRASGKGPRKR